MNKENKSGKRPNVVPKKIVPKKTIVSSQVGTQSETANNAQDTFLDSIFGLVPERYRRVAHWCTGGLMFILFLLGSIQTVRAYFPTSTEVVRNQGSEITKDGQIKITAPAKVDGSGLGVDESQVASTHDEDKLESAIANLPENEVFLKNWGEATLAFSRGNYHKVFELLPENLDKKFDQIDQDDRVLANRLQGLTKFRLDNWESAKNYFQVVLKIQPDNWMDRSSIGACEVNLGEFESAVKLYDKLLLPNQKLPEDKRYKLNLANAYNNRGIAKQKLGDFESASHDYEKAVSLINREQDPGYEPLVTKAVALNNLGTSLVAQAWKRSPDSTDPENVSGDWLAPFLEAIENYDKAIEVLLTDIPTDLNKYNRNDLAMVYGNRAVALTELGKFSKAKTDFKKSVEIREELLEEGNTELRQYLVRTLTNLAVLYEKGESWEEMAETCTDAIAVCETAIGDAGNNESPRYYQSNLIFIHALRGIAFEKLLQVEKSVEAYEQVVSLFRKDVDALEGSEYAKDYQNALNNLAWTYSTSEDKDLRNGIRAVEYAEEVDILNKENPVWEYLETLAAAYANVGEFGKAEKTQQAAMTRLTELQGTGSGSGGSEKGNLQYTATQFNEFMDELKSTADLYENQKPFRTSTISSNESPSIEDTPTPDDDEESNEHIETKTENGGGGTQRW